MYRVLLVDDEANVIKVLQMLIDWGKYGFEVAAEASDGAEALIKIDSLRPDLVITDVDMPGLNGIQLLKRVAQGNYACRTLLLTVYKDFQYIKSAMDCGAMGYLLKPVDETELADSLLRVKKELDEDRLLAAASPARADAGGPRAAPCAKAGRQKSGVEEVIAYIRLNYRRELTLKGLAEEFYLNPLYLGQLIKKETGESFNDFLARVRIENAIRLLENTNLKVYEISEKVGFKEIQYYYKTFKSITGTSPAAYRKNG
jgi:two-component system response regulator YesN